MGFMQSEEGIAERKKIADLTQTIGTVAPDHSKVMFKIASGARHGCLACLSQRLESSVQTRVRRGDGQLREIYELNRV